MKKQRISLLISVFSLAFLMSACQGLDIEKEQIPGKQTSDAVPERTTIHYSLKVSTGATKVSYENGIYEFKSGDKLYVAGLGERTDIEGYLQQNGEVWSGDLSYLTSKGEPADETEMAVTLIHADNDNTQSYASALVGTVPEGKTLLQYAVENYSLFTAQVSFATESATLNQQASFLDVTFKFDFDGTHTVQADQAIVDLTTTKSTASVEVDLVADDSNSEDYNVHFMAVVPGGQSTDQFALKVSDRDVAFAASTTMAPNKKYTVNREVAYRPQLGDPFWNDGTYGRLRHTDPSTEIVGIIVYVNHNYEDTGKAAIDDAITEKSSGYGHALVMALHNIAIGQRWCESSETQQCTGGLISDPEGILDPANLSGFTNTNSIVTSLTKASAASRAQGYAVALAPSANTTGWFLPSIGQWVYTISNEGFGGADPAEQWICNDGKRNWLTKGNLNDLIRVMDNAGNDDNLLIKSLNDRLEVLYSDFGCEYDSFGDPVGANVSDNYWTSSESKDGNTIKAFRMNLGTVEAGYATIKTKPESKTSTNFFNGYQAKVRPFLAF